MIDKKDWEAGYDWVVEILKLDHEYLASKMEIEKALYSLKMKHFDKVGLHTPTCSESQILAICTLCQRLTMITLRMAVNVVMQIFPFTSLL